MGDTVGVSMCSLMEEAIGSISKKPVMIILISIYCKLLSVKHGTKHSQTQLLGFVWHEDREITMVSFLICESYFLIHFFLINFFKPYSTFQTIKRTSPLTKHLLLPGSLICLRLTDWAQLPGSGAHYPTSFSHSASAIISWRLSTNFDLLPSSLS